MTESSDICAYIDKAFGPCLKTRAAHRGGWNPTLNHMFREPSMTEKWTVETALDAIRAGDSGEFWDASMEKPAREATVWLHEQARERDLFMQALASPYGHCFTLPDGNCVGRGCLHDVEGSKGEGG